jgi:2-polyprenyl-3-methyl-5-hydroxy-6-metoxy-1,4-benzoquinol methylase
MNTNLDYLSVNKESWNNRVDSHLASDFYDVAGFLKGDTSLNSIELNLLGDIKGKTILHLQCHFGQDSISLQRMGANVTGVDLSDVAIAAANELAKQTGTAPTFICCDVYDLPTHLHQQFDIVFTSYGTIGWLPDIDKWAKTVSHFLKPSGKFVFAEFHPVVWMFDDNFEKIGYNYFKADPIIEMESGTYADRDAPIQIQSMSWNHGMAEVITALLSQQLQLTTMQEFDYSPYPCFKNTIEIAPKQFRIKHLDNPIPMVYALVAIKPK